MGTNYYYHEAGGCKECGHGGEVLHIGKSSMGWCFSLHIDPLENISSLGDWLIRFEISGSHIANEYDEHVSPEEMIKIITCRSRDNPPTDFDWSTNKAFLGPFNMIRHIADGNHCVSNGPGTWDLIMGEFS